VDVVPLRAPAHLTAFYRALLDDGRRDRRGGLAPKTVRNVHGVLHAALRDAVRWGYLARNVADAADLPKGMTPQMRLWSPKAAPRLPRPRPGRRAVRGLDAVHHHRQAARRGRRAALGRRRPGHRPRLAPPAPGGRQLRRGRLRAEDRQGPTVPGARPGHGRRAARAPHPPGRAAPRGRAGLARLRPGLHLAGRPGDPPAALLQLVRAAPARPGCQGSGYTTSATATPPPRWPSASPKVVSERLGHATIAITMDTYSHVLPGLDELVAGTVARLILGDNDQPPSRPIDTPLTTGRMAPSERKEVTRESAGQRGASGGSRTPTSLRTPGPKLPTRRPSQCSPGLHHAFELDGCRRVVPSCIRSSRGVTARPVSNLVSIGGSGPRSRTPSALRSSATRDRIGRPGTARPIKAR
jgi:integrase